MAQTETCGICEEIVTEWSGCATCGKVFGKCCNSAASDDLCCECGIYMDDEDDENEIDFDDDGL